MHVPRHASVKTSLRNYGGVVLHELVSANVGSRFTPLSYKRARFYPLFFHRPNTPLKCICSHITHECAP